MKTSVKIAVFVIVAVVHFVASMIFFLRSFASSMERFDTGVPPTFSEQVMNFTSDVLFFPLIPLASLLPNWLGPLADLSFVLNSLLWSAVICFGIPIVLRRISGRRADSVLTRSRDGV